MEGFQLSSYFMLWLHHQNPPFEMSVVEEKIVEKGKEIERENQEDNVSEKTNQKNQDTIDKSQTESLKLSKKNTCLVRNQRDPDFNMKKQKKNRNVLSNLVHHLIKYLSNRPETQPYVSQIINYHCMTICIDEFYVLVENLNKILKSYVTQKNLLTLWKGQLIQSLQNNKKISAEFGKIMRVLSRKFYKETCRSSIFYSNKLSLESKELHYQGLHDIYELLLNSEKLKSGEKNGSCKKI